MSAVRRDAGIYRPRSAQFLRMVDAGSGTIKLNGLSAAAGGAIDQDLVEAAVAVIADAGELDRIDGRYDVGFAILHRGEEAFWLLLHWWAAGSVTTHRHWRAERRAGPVRFEPGPEAVMACVWELGVIGFERKAWIETVMSGRPVEDYLAMRMPRSTV